jgi:hypothetical protein
MATRYHKVKFFGMSSPTSPFTRRSAHAACSAERQKVSRKIAQTLRALEAEDLEKKERKKLKRALEELRVDLNYIVVCATLSPSLLPSPSRPMAEGSTMCPLPKVYPGQPQLRSFSALPQDLQIHLTLSARGAWRSAGGRRLRRTGQVRRAAGGAPRVYTCAYGRGRTTRGAGGRD